MKPLVHSNEMTDITQAEQKKLCRCSSQCKRFVVISYTRGPVLTMCETEAKQYIEEVAMAMGLAKPNFIKGNRPWTSEEEEKLREHHRKYKGKYGHAKLLAAEINRTPEQIKHKVKHMKAKGEL